MAETATMPAKNAGSATRPMEFTIEMATEQCGNVAFPPTKDILRGAWQKAKVLVGVSSRGELHKLPDMPGMRISLNCQTKTGKIFDPLGLPENSGLLESIKRPYAAVAGQEGRPEDERTYSEMTYSQMKTWAYWMRRLVEAGNAYLVHGNLPSYEDITRMDGKTQVELYRTSSKRVFKEDAPYEEEYV